MFLADVRARHERWLGLRKVMCDERGTMSAGRDRIPRPVETMMTADSLRLTVKFCPFVLKTLDEFRVKLLTALPKAQQPGYRTREKRGHNRPGVARVQQ
jgi:hypothetical protein